MLNKFSQVKRFKILKKEQLFETRNLKMIIIWEEYQTGI